jgi:hypothetical protein
MPMSDEIRASVGAHRDLGPGYEDAVAQGLVDRIGIEIDRRIDTHLGRAGDPPPTAPPARLPGRGHAIYAPVVVLGSFGMGVAATAILSGPSRGTGKDIVILAMIWVVIMVVNVVYARNKS